MMITIAYVSLSNLTIAGGDCTSIDIHTYIHRVQLVCDHIQSEQESYKQGQTTLQQQKYCLAIE